MKRVRSLLHMDDYRELRNRPCDFSIAVLDSGAEKHPDIASNMIGFVDFTEGRKNCYDDFGHGTHIAGILCGSGTLSGGLYEGVMPSANMIPLKILDRNGDGMAAHMLEALEWIEDNKKKYNIRLVNISVGVENCVKETNRKSMQAAVSRLYRDNVLVITAAGNNGPAPMTLSALGEGEDVIAVGCYDFGYLGKDGRCCAEYSARGPSRYSMKKPDIVAPGTEIVSCSNQYRRGRRYAYCTKSGTSMATAVVTGAAAMLLAKENHTAAQLKQKLRYAAKNIHEPWNFQGWGVLDIERLLA